MLRASGSAMDFFAPLRMEVPRIAYSVLHQRKAAVAEADYVTTLLELTRQAGERAVLASERIRGWRDAQARDLMEGVPRNATERLRRLLEAACPVPSVQGGLELATIGVELPDPRLDKLAGAGREYLASLGFRNDGDAPVHESVVFFVGSWNYDFVEHVVRDEMGIYEDPHLQHVREMGTVMFYTQNLVAACGDGLGSKQGEWQPAVFFSKGPTRYDDFRSTLGRAIEHAVAQAGLRGISLWQRKLGMGNIFEWELRVRCDRDPERLVQGLDVIASYGGEAGARVVERGRLVVYEVIG